MEPTAVDQMGKTNKIDIKHYRLVLFQRYINYGAGYAGRY